jgi:hypothetical protein
MTESILDGRARGYERFAEGNFIREYNVIQRRSLRRWR